MITTSITRSFHIAMLWQIQNYVICHPLCHNINIWKVLVILVAIKLFLISKIALFFSSNFFNLATVTSSHRRCSVKKGVLRNFAKFTGKNLCQSLFFNKVAGLWPATLLKKRLWQRCFSVNFAGFLGTPFLQNTSRRLYLNF